MLPGKNIGRKPWKPQPTFRREAVKGWKKWKWRGTKRDSVPSSWCICSCLGQFPHGQSSWHRNTHFPPPVSRLPNSHRYLLLLTSDGHCQSKRYTPVVSLFFNFISTLGGKQKKCSRHVVIIIRWSRCPSFRFLIGLTSDASHRVGVRESRTRFADHHRCAATKRIFYFSPAQPTTAVIVR